MFAATLKDCWAWAAAAKFALPASFGLAHETLSRLAFLATYESVLAYLDTRADVKPGKIGVTGYCMGGLLALALASIRQQDLRGLVLLATGVFQFHGAVTVAVSTLVAAALFNPLRRQIQQLVDRRFNRARYDADKIVTAFAGRLQDAVDLDAVQDDLARIVHDAFEPAHISVWVRPHA